jgi:hypothetical protein
MFANQPGQSSHNVFGEIWLRVLGTAKRPEIDQCTGHQFHAVVPLLFESKRNSSRLNLSFHAKVRSTHSRNE